MWLPKYQAISIHDTAGSKPVVQDQFMKNNSLWYEHVVDQKLIVKKKYPAEKIPRYVTRQNRVTHMCIIKLGYRWIQ